VDRELGSDDVDNVVRTARGVNHHPTNAFEDRDGCSAPSANVHAHPATVQPYAAVIRQRPRVACTPCVRSR
jgi:hypothetical protein